MCVAFIGNTSSVQWSLTGRIMTILLSPKQKAMCTYNARGYSINMRAPDATISGQSVGVSWEWILRWYKVHVTYA